MIMSQFGAPRRVLSRVGVRVAGAVLALGLTAQTGFADIPVVKLTTVNAAGGELRRVFFGKVVARETVDLAFQVGGQILDFPVEEGASVAQGALIARMDLEPFTLALDEAEARVAQANRIVDRYEQLVGSAISATNLEDALTEAELADISLRNAERSLRNATLHAPFGAIVAARLVPNFSTVSAGTPVVRLHDMSDLRIEIDVPETLLQRAGQNPDVRFSAKFPFSDRSFPMEIREFNAETADVGQTYSITLGMPMVDDLNVLPGSSAKVTATLKNDAQHIELPTSAIVIGNDNQTHVMVFEPVGAAEGTVSLTPVDIVPTDRGTVQVIAGLEDGQEVVSIGAVQLENGATVRRFTGFGD